MKSRSLNHFWFNLWFQYWVLNTMWQEEQFTDSGCKLEGKKLLPTSPNVSAGSVFYWGSGGCFSSWKVPMLSLQTASQAPTGCTSVLVLTQLLFIESFKFLSLCLWSREALLQREEGRAEEDDEREEEEQGKWNRKGRKNLIH